MSNIGINLVEVDGRATPSIQGAATSVAGFLGRTTRGVPGVRNVTNWSDFLESFGPHRSGAFLAYAIKGFFENGGAQAYVARIVDNTALASTIGWGPSNGYTLTAAYRGQLDPGPWGDKIKVTVTNPPKGNDPAATWTLVVEYDGKVVETWDHLPFTAAGVAKINDEFSGSKFVKMVCPDASVVPPLAATALAGGADTMDQTAINTFAIAALGGGLNPTGVFDTYNVQLIACPETTDDTVLTQGISYCGGRGDCIYIAATPDTTPAAAQSFGLAKRANNVYAALYYPFVRVSDPLGSVLWIPPVGHVMGVYARTELERGIWKAPAGVQANVRGVLDVHTHISDTTHTNLVKIGVVNALRYIAGQGIVLDSSRTLSASPLWQFVNVRLLFNYVKSSLKNSLRWVVQEPNDPTLWNKVKFNSVVPFLSDLWRRGAFGPGAKDDVFSVKIDMENNPPANIQQGILNIEVYFYPSRPAETFIITVGQQEGSSTASES